MKGNFVPFERYLSYLQDGTFATAAGRKLNGDILQIGWPGSGHTRGGDLRWGVALVGPSMARAAGGRRRYHMARRVSDGCWLDNPPLGHI